MNIYQRIILIVGAIVFFFVLMGSPRVKIMKGSVLNPSTGREGLAKVIDIRTASVRGFAVLGATALLFFATKSKKKD